MTRKLLVAACLARLLAAIENPALGLSESSAPMTVETVYRPPSALLRDQADAIDRRDAAVHELRAAIAACRADAPTPEERR